MDPAAVEKNYREIRKDNERSIVPLVIDLTNPGPGIGWRNLERASFVERGPADAVMALALVHYLAISNNVPLGMIAEFLASIGKTLVIEFVPKEDSRVRRLLASRDDIFGDYNEHEFERQFSRFFRIERKVSIAESLRSLYLMRRADSI